MVQIQNMYSMGGSLRLFMAVLVVCFVSAKGQFVRSMDHFALVGMDGSKGMLGRTTKIHSCTLSRQACIDKEGLGLKAVYRKDGDTIRSGDRVGMR